jgi:GNAT superfamily N-acetyltransferase
MTQRKSLIFDVLNKFHDHSDFSCGIEALDVYLKCRAGQEFRRHVAFPYVMTFKGEVQVRGFYTLSAYSVPFESLPSKLAKLTRYDRIPSLLIGRLALDEDLHGQGYSQLLLMDALRRIARSKDFAVMLVIVDSKDQQAADFYAHFGFMPLNNDSKRLFLPFKTIAKL